MNSFILYGISAAFFVLFVWVMQAIWLNARLGEPLTRTHQFGMLAVAANVVLTLILYQWYGQSELHALAWATMVIAIGSLLVLLLAFAIFLFAFRKSKMEKVYQEYDMLMRKGMKPCIVTSSIFGPRVIEWYPDHMQVGMDMWSEGGKLHYYATTTQARLDRAIARC